MADFTYDQIKYAFDNSTDEEKQTILNDYPIVQYAPDQLRQVLDSSTDEEKKIIFNDYPDLASLQTVQPAQNIQTQPSTFDNAIELGKNIVEKTPGVVAQTVAGVANIPADIASGLAKIGATGAEEVAKGIDYLAGSQIAPTVEQGAQTVRDYANEAQNFLPTVGQAASETLNQVMSPVVGRTYQPQSPDYLAELPTDAAVIAQAQRNRAINFPEQYPDESQFVNKFTDVLAQDYSNNGLTKFAMNWMKMIPAAAKEVYGLVTADPETRQSFWNNPAQTVATVAFGVLGAKGLIDMPKAMTELRSGEAFKTQPEVINQPIEQKTIQPEVTSSIVPGIKDLLQNDIIKTDEKGQPILDETGNQTVVGTDEKINQLKQNGISDEHINGALNELIKENDDLIKKQQTQPVTSGNAFALPNQETPTNTPDYSKINPSLIEISDLLDLSKQIGDITPNVKERLRLAKGNALGAFYSGLNKIDIRADLAKNPERAKSVLAHEIGHLVDFKEGSEPKTLSRGNILGHVAALYKYLKNTIANDETIYKKPEIKAELENATAQWNGITRAQIEANPKYKKYFFSPSEMYANTFSIFVNNPQLLKELAPKTHQMFTDYMVNRPEALIAYNNMLKAIEARRTGETNVGKIIYDKTAEMFQHTNEKVLQHLDKQPDNNLMNDLATALVDRNWSTLLTVGNKMHVVNALEKMAYQNSISEAYMRSIGFDDLKKSGLTEDDLGHWDYYQRIINDRGKTPKNPEEYDGRVFDRINDKQAQAALESMPPEKLKLLADYHKKFWQQRNKFVISKLREAGIYNDNLMNKISNNEFYSTWNIVKYLDDTYGKGNAISATIKKQIGTFQEVMNPFTATVMKDLALMKMADRSIAAKLVVNELLSKGDATKAKYNWNISDFERPPNGKGMIAFLDKGDYVGYYVDKRIADSFDQNPVQSSATQKALTGILSVPSGIIRQLYIGYNAGFQAFNILRDSEGNFSKLPGTLSNFSTILKYQVQEIVKAIRNTQAQELITDMLGKGELISAKEVGLNAAEYKTPLEFLKASYGLGGEKVSQQKINYLFKVANIFKPMMDIVKDTGTRLETASKIAGRRYLDTMMEQKKINISEAEKSHMIRAWAGSPAFMRKGEAYGIYNNLFMFSNSIKEGIRADIEAYKYNPKEYLQKKMLFSIAPKVLMLALAAGASDWWDKVSEYDKTNYIIIPLPYDDEQGNIAYMRLPQDEFSRLIGGLFWKSMKPVMNQELTPKDVTSLLGFTAGQLPNINPLLTTLSDTLQFACGQNPYDYFRGQPLINDQVFKAQDLNTVADFLKHEANGLGLQTIYKMPTGINLDKNEIQQLIEFPLLGANIWGRFIKIGQQGLNEKAYNLLDQYQQEKARESIQKKAEMPPEQRTANQKKNIPLKIRPQFNEILNQWKTGGQ